MSPIERPDNTATETKRLVRTYLSQWHADVRGEEKIENMQSGDLTVANVLTRLLPQLQDGNVVDGLEDIEYWPAYFETGQRVVFPPLTPADTGHIIFLPRTPKEFFDLLEYIQEYSRFPEKNFAKTAISKARSSSGSRYEHARETDSDTSSMEDFATFIESCSTFDELARAYDLVSLFSGTNLHAAGIPMAIDSKAVELFEKAMQQARNKKDSQKIRQRLETFRFFSPTSRDMIIAYIDLASQNLPEVGTELIEAPSHELLDTQKEARRLFIEKIHVATRKEELQRLFEESGAFNFFNRGELGIVRSAISRKMKKLS